MEKLMVANVKMNFNQAQAKTYLETLLALGEAKHKAVVCLPFTSLPVASQILQQSFISLGAQNVCEEENGAFTGEISAEMLNELNCQYAIVGHSERRKYFAETDESVNKKIKLLLKHSIKPIVCVGENLKEKETNKTNAVLESQISKALSGLYENEVKRLVVAYEPVWAIGTGKNAAVKDAENAIVFIRACIGTMFSESAAKQIQILYGGSVKTDNAKSYLNSNQIDGALIGGASLDAINYHQLLNVWR